MADFDISRIPDHALHEAVYETLGSQKIEKISNGYRFRCPICGDSKRNKIKKRGYVLYGKGKWVYVCHNECGTMSFLNYLKKFHHNIYKKLIFFGFGNSGSRKKREKTEIEESYKANKIYKFKKGELLGIYDDHPTAKNALQFCKDRKIRKEAYSNFFACVKDDKFLDKDSNGRFVMNDKGFPKGNEYGNRLIIPYYRFGGKWIQFDARALNDDAFLRYRNLEDADRELYNVDWLDVTKQFFMLEGSINSSFIRNSCAFGGTKHLKQFLEQHPEIAVHAENGVFIWDNDDPGYDEMQYTIGLGFKWFNWSSISPCEKYKLREDGAERIINDVNDMVLYTDFLKFDKAGYIKNECLEPYIETAGGGKIKTMMLYGNREKKRKVKYKQLFQKIKKKDDNKIILNVEK